MRHAIKRFLPQKLLTLGLAVRASIAKSAPVYFVHTVLAFCNDCFRFLTCAGMFRQASHPDVLRFRIMRDTHKIEKGLSLTAPRPGFGKEVVGRIVNSLERYSKTKQHDVCIRSAISVLREYSAFQARVNGIDPKLTSQINAVCQCLASKEPLDSAVYCRRRDEILSAAQSPFGELAKARFSARKFGPEEVSIDLITEAVQIAQRTPSVCNRQCWRVRVYGEQTRENVLRVQNGNRGFREYIDKVLIITADLGSFFEPGERNQGYIDGGMYAMSLVYALQSLGVASCCLNLSMTPSRANALRRAGDIRKDEILIMMIAVGTYPDAVRVARSARYSHQDMMIIHD